MIDKNTYCIIMAGGAGTRMWPVSRAARPKQFLPLGQDEVSMLKTTWDRFSSIIPPENILIVTADRYAGLVKEQVPDVLEENIITEPYSRDTAPCIAYASMKVLLRNSNAVTVVSPADHLIPNTAEFTQTLEEAMNYARENDVLMTLGLVPTCPDTNYGYIQVTGGTGACYLDGARKVKTFTEKPSIEMAKIFLGTGEFLWNSGIFVWKASVILNELQALLPEVMGPFTGWKDNLETDNESAFVQRAYSDCLRISIDYGVMEKTDKAWVFPAKFEWYDIGSWHTISDVLSKDSSSDNVTAGGACVLAQDSKRNFVMAKGEKKLVAIKGLKDYMVVDSGNVLMICPKDDIQFKELLASLAMPGFEEFK